MECFYKNSLEELTSKPFHTVPTGEFDQYAETGCVPDAAGRNSLTGVLLIRPKFVRL